MAAAKSNLNLQTIMLRRQVVALSSVPTAACWPPAFSSITFAVPDFFSPPHLRAVPGSLCATSFSLRQLPFWIS